MQILMECKGTFEKIDKFLIAFIIIIYQNRFPLLFSFQTSA